MRLKIIAGNLIAILAIGLVSFFVVKSQIETALAKEVDQEIVNDGTLFDRSWRLSGLRFLENVRDRAATQDAQVVFSALDEDSRRERAYRAAEGVSQWFRDPARGREGPPDIVVITDETGKVVARDKDKNRMHGKQLVKQLPLLREVLGEGEARHDVWEYKGEDKLLQTGMAPIHSDQGAILGALVVGYDLSNGLAKSEAEVLNREVAFLAEGEIYSSSSSGNAVEELEKYLFGPLETQTTSAMQGKASTPWDAELAGARWVGVTAPLAMSGSAKVAYVVFANKTEKLALADSTYLILILTLIGLLGVGVYGFIVGSSLMRPLEQIEEDVLQVINGRTDLRIDVESQEFGGLAYRINQLINVFEGVAEEDEEGRVSQSPAGAGVAPAGGEGGAWQGGPFSEGGGASASSGGGGQAADVIDDPNVASQLAAEPEDQYFTRVYNEYVAAKQSVGEDVSNIPQDRFVQRLRGNAKALVQKHGCKDVRFQVQTRGNQVVLRPVLIR